MGFRYSPTRDAWVHRMLGGRVGPVFRELDLDDGAGIVDTMIYERMLAARMPRVQPEAERAPLPRRQVARPRRMVRVEARLHHSESPRTVLVDGQPPRRGIDPREFGARDHNVVPIKSARSATA